MTSTITDTHRRIVVSEVRDVIVTETIADGGGYARAVRIMGTVAGTEGPAEIVELVLTAEAADNLKFEAPVQSF